ncbi:hypothetical protein [Pontibacter sp. G13]|uniref:hypothetical protein n=1 Tax=Pontibacter sp. G13 TaxID=3074898 RepID=UPI00288AE96C|nr:hypothetical protein [Pontibacter sp. G13]WNJ21259.1 hypothetical protein RJD25_12390 [Pontibacter sp. G13]
MKSFLVFASLLLVSSAGFAQKSWSAFYEIGVFHRFQGEIPFTGIHTRKAGAIVETANQRWVHQFYLPSFSFGRSGTDNISQNLFLEFANLYQGDLGGKWKYQAGLLSQVGQYYARQGLDMRTRRLGEISLDISADVRAVHQFSEHWGVYLGLQTAIMDLGYFYSLTTADANNDRVVDNNVRVVFFRDIRFPNVRGSIGVVYKI